jgi:hypothetical protein
MQLAGLEQKAYSFLIIWLLLADCKWMVNYQWSRALDDYISLFQQSNDMWHFTLLDGAIFKYETYNVLYKHKFPGSLKYQ